MKTLPITYKKLVIALFIVVTGMPSHSFAADPKFRRPLDSLLSPTFSAYYDHDTGSSFKNYYCKTDTGYNGHKGTDFRAKVPTDIFAAANGGLWKRYDSCNNNGFIGNTCGDSFGNHAWIDHEGNTSDGVGWQTIYAHMYPGTVAYFQSTKCGAKIGMTGSSGNVDGPHLHFEVRKYSYPNNDPFSGACSGSTSFWVNQNNGTPTTQCQ